jgi:hypothetical protein
MDANVKASLYVMAKLVTPEKGHEIIRWPEADMKKMKEIFRPSWNKWADEMEKKGYPGKAILKHAEIYITAYSNN